MPHLFAGRGAPFRPLAPTSMPDPARPPRRPGPAAAPAVAATLAVALRRAEHLPPRLREALALAADDDRAIRTVEKLASAAGCDRRTLWTHWKHAVGRSEELRLEDFLHWLLLLRAARRKTPALAWADVAKEIGIHPHTLSRLARQLTGLPLRELAARGHASLALRFEAEVLARVLEPPSLDRRGGAAGGD